MPLPLTPPETEQQAAAVVALAAVEISVAEPPPAQLLSKDAQISFSYFAHNPAPPVTAEAALAIGGVAALAVLLIAGDNPLRKKVMDVDLNPLEFPEVTLHVLGRRIEGSYSAQLVNTGELPFLSATMKDAITAAEQRVLESVKQAGYLAAKAAWENRSLFQISGWAVVRALWDLFVHRVVTIRSKALVSEFFLFRKDFDIVASIPVRKLNISVR